MTNEILINILDRVKRACECNAKQLQKNYYVARNGCVLGDFVTTTLLQMIKREKNFVFTDESVWTNDQCFEETACNAIVNNNICSLPHNTCTVFTLNCLDSRFEDFSERQG